MTELSEDRLGEIEGLGLQLREAEWRLLAVVGGSAEACHQLAIRGTDLVTSGDRAVEVCIAELERRALSS